MQHILDQLSTRLDTAPDNDTALLRHTVIVLRHIQRHPHGPRPVSWEALHRNFQCLRDHGLWEPSTENDELLDALRVLLTSPPLQQPVELHEKLGLGEKFSIFAPPPQGVSSQLVPNQVALVLPVELIDVLNHAYFIHILATDPAQVLPPGKSLLSVLSRSRVTADRATKPKLLSKIEDIAHKAFWDEATSALSDSEPSAQLSRLRLLYRDLHVALSPLLPPKHSVLATLSGPLSPTSSPLDSAVMHLREILACLRQRCAPVRDLEIEALQCQLDDPPIGSSRVVALATLVAETVRNILKLSEIMKDDLSQFVLGGMTEHQLECIVMKQAKTSELEIVIDLWRRDRIVQEWVSWLDKLKPPAHLSIISAEPRFLWIVRMVQALGSPLPVYCPPPSGTDHTSPTTSSDRSEILKPSVMDANTLPPIFFFSAPALLKIQNYLQALVIAASLRILAYLPPLTRSPHASSSLPDPESFMSRIWTLLRAEVAGEPVAGDIKVINFADEVVLARTQVTATPSAPTSLSDEDEATLRAAVDRTLRYEDPVYKLLQRRLLTELSNVLVKRRQGDAVRRVVTWTSAGPATLRTGKGGERVRKRQKFVIDLKDMDESHIASRSSPRIVTDVKGFEDPVLSQAIAGVFEQVDKCLWWVESVWSDVIDMDGSLRSDT